MKLKSLGLAVFAFYIGMAVLHGCTKSISEQNAYPSTPSYSKSIPEIGLKANFNFQRANPDAFTISLSDGFLVDNFSSLYNSDQQMEYFTVRCKKLNGPSYLLSGTVDAKGTVTIFSEETIYN